MDQFLRIAAVLSLIAAMSIPVMAQSDDGAGASSGNRVIISPGSGGSSTHSKDTAPDSGSTAPNSGDNSPAVQPGTEANTPAEPDAGTEEASPPTVVEPSNNTNNEGSPSPRVQFEPAIPAKPSSPTGAGPSQPSAKSNTTDEAEDSVAESESGWDYDYEDPNPKTLPQTGLGYGWVSAAGGAFAFAGFILRRRRL